MTPVDRDILDLLQNGDRNEMVLTPSVLAANSDWDQGTVRNHLLTLRKHGMVSYYDKDRGLHQLSVRGRAWLNGEDDPEGADFDDE
ncbi:helix-turn-helix domain-containing protein [Halorubellus sp. PRR65]|uniref:helix-turn-helix domain-containing protein n=1 Tax=Halorubellus sp. PRR65 TaxID=3098148 RepID=UPI002B25BBCF|nr:helix-turn-helix domain-containing protein [Halorubellus sp. PRR65]